MASTEAEVKLYADLPESVRADIDVEKRKVRDFISGQRVNATPTEIEAIQVFARKLVDDYDYPKAYIQTHPQFHVRKRPSDEQKEYPVDIAVFNQDKKTELNLFMIVECKEPSKTTGLRQLKIYMDRSPANVGVWFNGKEHAYIRKVQKADGTLQYLDLPNIPRFKQPIEDIGLFKRKDLKKTRILKAIFKDIRNTLSQKAVGITRDEALAQEVMNLLFCKIFDEVNTGPEEILTFRSGVGESDKTVADRIRKELFVPMKATYEGIFDKSDSINLDDSSINYVVGELQGYCITEAERDVLGNSFEVFIGPALKGAQGQFFTPRNVVRLAVEILDPSPSDLLIDPACGSGGFLVVALEYVWQKLREDCERRGFDQDWIKAKQKEIAGNVIRGIDKDNFLVKVTKAYMAIVGNGHGGIFCENSLERPEKWEAKTQERIKLETFNVLFANPPFGAKIPIRDKEILENFDTGYNWKKKQKGKVWEKTDKVQDQQPPQILFIERCLEFLKVGGKMAIVLPDGVLGGSKIGYIAHFMRRNAKVLALVDLPKETFQPNVSTKTHLVFLEKTEGEATDDYPVFMAIADYIGHDSKGKPILQDINGVREPRTDLLKISSKFKEYKNGRLAADKFDRQGYVVSSKWLENCLVAVRYLPQYINVLQELETLKIDGKIETATIDDIKSREEGLFTGANVSAEEYVNHSPYRYIMTDCVTEAGLNGDSFKYISEKAYNRNKTKILKENDIVINRTGKSGVAAIIPKDIEGTLACGFVFVLRLKEGYDPFYVTAFLNSRLGKYQTERFTFGSVLNHITKDDLETIIVATPKDASIASMISQEERNAVANQEKSRMNLQNIHAYFERIK